MNVFGARLALATATASVLVTISCRSLTPMELVLDERVKGHLSGLARSADRTWGPFGVPASSRTDGRWTYHEWQFSGQVHRQIELLDVGWHTDQRYRYRHVGEGTRHADCKIGFWHRIDGATISYSANIGPKKDACLQLLYPELRLDR